MPHPTVAAAVAYLRARGWQPSPETLAAKLGRWRRIDPETMRFIYVSLYPRPGWDRGYTFAGFAFQPDKPDIETAVAYRAREREIDLRGQYAARYRNR